MIKTLLLDLDGTLLPMDQEEFVKYYFKGLSGHLAKYGYEPEKLIRSVWKGTMAMYANSTGQTNEQVFWEAMSAVYGADCMKDLPLFEEFYNTDFQKIADVCSKDDGVYEVMQTLKKDYRLVLATNPLFPSIATRSRILWAGLDPSDFEWITTYENCTRTKPSPEYFLEILQKLDLDPKECLMIGNDALEDLAARQAGIDVFLVNTHLINTQNVSLANIPCGNFQDLLQYLEDRRKDSNF